LTVSKGKVKDVAHLELATSINERKTKFD